MNNLIKFIIFLKFVIVDASLLVDVGDRGCRIEFILPFFFFFKSRVMQPQYEHFR